MFARLLCFGLTTAIILATLYVSRCDPVAANPPRDADLVGLFRSHRDAFEKLAAMGMEDSNTTTFISIEALNQEPLTGGREALSPARRTEYKQLLASIRPDLAMDIDWLSVSFSYWRGGTSLSIGRIWMKGIAYVPHGLEKLGTIVAALDKLPTEDGAYFVSSEPRWYIVYVQRD